MASEAETGRFSIAQVLGDAVGVFRDNPATMFGLTLIFSILPSVFVNYLEVQTAMGVDPESPFDTEGFFGMWLLSIIVSIVVYLIMQAVIVRATFVYARGDGRASIGESIGAALPVLGPLLVMIILFYLGVMLGVFLLIVPGIILAVMWSVSTPALVVERLGATEALGRSRALTKGSRWKIFGLYLLTFILVVLLGLLMVGIFALIGINIEVDGTDIGLIGIAIASILEGLYNAFFAAIGTSLYVALRQIKEGPDTRQLEDIFA